MSASATPLPSTAGRVSAPARQVPAGPGRSLAAALREALPEPVMDAGRRAVSTYGLATAHRRTTADFLIIGAKRGGTTSLYHHLLRHPSVLELFPSARLVPKRRATKGLHFFDRPTVGPARRYRANFPTVGARVRAEISTSGPVVVGEASPYYLFHPLAPQRAQSLLPEAKLIAILRDPVERTYSHYREQVRNGVEALTFEAALEAEDERLATTDAEAARWAHEQQSYATQSIYEPLLQRWLQSYPQERLLVLCSEEYFVDPVTVLRTVWDFLGIPHVSLPSQPALNAAPRTPMAASTRARLVDRFATANTALFDLLGRTLPWQMPG